MKTSYSVQAWKTKTNFAEFSKYGFSEKAGLAVYQALRDSGAFVMVTLRRERDYGGGISDSAPIRQWEAKSGK